MIKVQCVPSCLRRSKSAAVAVKSLSYDGSALTQRFSDVVAKTCLLDRTAAFEPRPALFLGITCSETVSSFSQDQCVGASGKPIVARAKM